ncbi:hypothetical protein BKA64DRAFT_650961 [Cadophora sp. MPI-SDFR-AT-0126]|nr:hypothetical protein BKA64DRAFT_650961 [Leotiomycetes sp. MPI-SDFR-AT-0126]
MSSACVLWWLGSLQWPHNGIATYGCGGSLLASTVLFYCVDTTPTLSEGLLSSKCLAYAPERLMISGVQRAISHRRTAIQDLQDFLRHISGRMEELHGFADTSIELCNSIKRSFVAIQDLVLENQYKASDTSTVVANELSDAGYWKKPFDSAGRTSSKARLVELRMEMRYQEEIQAIHRLASDSFIAKSLLLREWRVDVDRIRKNLDFLEIQTTHNTWHTVRDGNEDWNRLKRKMRDLEILALDPLAKAFSNLRTKSRQDLAHLHRLTADCYAATHEAIRRVFARPTVDYIFERLHFGRVV